MTDTPHEAVPLSLPVTETTIRNALAALNFLKIGDLQAQDLANLAPTKHELAQLTEELDRRAAEHQRLVAEVEEAQHKQELGKAKPPRKPRARAVQAKESA